MNDNKLKIIVTAGAIFVGCLVVLLWLFLPFSFSPRNQAPVTSQEFFLIKIGYVRRKDTCESNGSISSSSTS